MSRLPYLTTRLQGFGTTIFSEMTALANQHAAVNLGQGFPDFEGPAEIKEAVIDAMRAGHNQYCPGQGIPALRQAIAEHQKRFYDLDYDPDREVTVFAGATEAIASSLLALCEAGDEVVLFEPFYDSYRAAVAMAGASPRVIPLRDPDFRYDPELLELSIGPKTRVLVLNSPHNPTGKVYSRAELEHIAKLCIEHDVLVLSDEVYEHLTFGEPHVPIATLPGMKERTLTISSAGKTFSFTGWKIGWACAGEDVTRAIRTSHQFVTFCNGTPFQHGIAHALRMEDAFFETFQAEYQVRRDKLCAGLRDVGFKVLDPAGTYFACVDIRALGFKDDMTLCRLLPEKVGVAAIPNSAFYLDPRRGKHLVRFAFCKTDPVLDEGIARLRKNVGNLKAGS